MAARTCRVSSIRLALILTAAIWLLSMVLYWNTLQRPALPLKEVFPYGELRIAIDASNPPFAVATADDFVGLEVDLGRMLATEIGISARFVNMTFDSLYDSLKADQVDIVIATLSIDPLRTREVRYTRPYFNAGLVLVSPAHMGFSHMRQLSGYTLSYEFGSSADSQSRVWLRRIPSFEVRPYELPQHALDAVRLNDAEAALVDRVSTRLYLRQHSDWSVHLEDVTYVPYVIAARFDRELLWEAVDKALQVLIEDGRLTEMINKWL